MALADNEIAERIHYGDMTMSPYNDENLQPASYDLRLGREFKVLRMPSLWERLKQNILTRIPFSSAEPAHIDPMDDDITKRVVRLNRGSEFILRPNEFVLGHTQEVVGVPDDVVGVVHGRSSWARVGVNPHLGGYIDPGFEGQITLEFSNLTSAPIKLRVGQRICQIAFHEMNMAASDPYEGKYQGDSGAEGTRLNDDSENLPPTVETFFVDE